MARMKTSRKWFDIVRRKIARASPGKNIVVLRSNACSSPDETKSSGYEKLILSSLGKQLTEDVAAIKIQSIFRGHLARRAFRALRSLVKLQALVRGAYVRKQTRIALHCMQALVRLQVRVRARQLLGRCSDN